MRQGFCTLCRATALVAAVAGIGSSARADLLVTDYLTPQVRAYDQMSGAFKGVFASGNGITNSKSDLSLTFGPDRNLYVADFIGNDVLRFNGQTGAFIDKFIPSVTQPEHLTFGPDKNLYVSSRGHQVNRYDGTTGSLLGSITGGGLRDPVGLTFGPDGRLYVADFDNFQHDGQVLRYDGKTGAFIDVFVSQGSGGLQDPSGLAFGADGNLYVSDYRPTVGLAGVRLYDGKTGASLGNFTPGFSDYAGQAAVDLAFGPDKNLYVTDGNQTILRFDPKSGALIDRFIHSSFGHVDYFAFTPSPASAVPEPASLLLAGTAALTLCGYGWRRARRRGNTGPC